MTYFLNINLSVKKLHYLVFGVFLSLLLMSCQSTEQAEIKADQVALTMCPDVRPQMCTMEYMPVCGSKNDASTKTYGNACSACGDAEVTGYIVGECEAN